MRIIETAIDVDAPAEAVWAVVSDFTAFPTWNPFLVTAEGDLGIGARLRVTFKAGRRRPVTLRPTVTELEPGRALCWQGRLLLPRIFDGAHELRVEPLADGRSRFVQRETFRGVLVPLFGRLLADTRTGFEAMNAALKERAEDRARMSRR